MAKPERGELTLPMLWKSAKYISWPVSHANPIVRIPLPSGAFESHSVVMTSSEYETFEKCERLRDALGRQIWGEARWAYALKVGVRSVAKHRKARTGPITGVSHYERPERNTRGWVANWYELQKGNTRKKRSKQFSYGGPYSQYATSEQAREAAIKKRQEEEVRWYSVLGEGNERIANKKGI